MKEKSKLLSNIRGLKTVANVLDTGTTDRLVREFERAVRADERERAIRIMRSGCPVEPGETCEECDITEAAIREGKGI